eukprot:TRINITY_DN15391_c0_g1_i1.p1 TRINITY_DN15391_c0_g1~~TRINITY_DN15391_c0_g1_i1.p1  ORF type:complete len:476 (-),score=105.11 TRINITY_DN15391_c0_g1_i1:192-1619(-)
MGFNPLRLNFHTRLSPSRSRFLNSGAFCHVQSLRVVVPSAATASVFGRHSNGKNFRDPIRLTGQLRGASSSSASPSDSAGMLSQLPDYIQGSTAMEAGNFDEALAPLQRASEVAVAYFPAAGAGRELVICLSAYGRCLWYAGRASEAAQQFEAGHEAANKHLESNPAIKAVASSYLAEASARVHFELGDFDKASALISEALSTVPSSSSILKIRLQMLDEALKVVTSGTSVFSHAGASEVSSDEALILEAIRRTNSLVAHVFPNGDLDSAKALDALSSELGAGGPLANLLAVDAEAAEASNSEQTGLPHGMERMALRSTAGQLAVSLEAFDEPWARPLLVAALKDYEDLQPKGPTLKPFLYRTLTAVGTLTGKGGKGEAVTAEGLFRSALGHAEEPTPSPASLLPRAKIWRALNFFSFARLLEGGRRAEERKTDIASFERQADRLLDDEELTAEELRWAAIYLPPPMELKATMLV